MSKQPCFDAEYLRKGDYAVICSTSVEANGYPVKFKAFEQMMRQAMNDLKKVQPINCRCDIAVELSLPLSIKLVIPAGRQGWAFAEGDYELTIEETALAEAESLAKEAENISISALDHGNEMASEAERQSISLEKGAEEFSASVDEDVSRQVFSRSRGPERSITYLNGDRKLGGRRQVPSHLQSTDLFYLKGCKVLQSQTKTSLMIEGAHNDSEWRRLNNAFPGCHMMPVHVDSPVVLSLKLAQALGITVDLDVSVKQKIANRQHLIIPIGIRNPQAIIDTLSQSIHVVRELL